MHSIDLYVQSYFSVVRKIPVTEFMYLLTILFDLSFAFVLVTIAVSILIYLVKGYSHAFLFVGSLVAGGLLVYLLKNLFNISRPPGAVIYAFGQSFPSWHATISAIFFIMLVYILGDHLRKLWRVLFILFCIVSVFLVAFSRVYLGVHWVSDVVFGLILGCSVAYACVHFFERLHNMHKVQ